ncbi:MAG: suppressor of fused domain protein [Lachnospiraceae bacterium]|nr:suppressor of fused domain protein [Ruminococcus sp.]MCM1275200.1 suppressor of fused domain protein [Lachnospiraceae bacterium]
MKKSELIELFEDWREEGENEKIVQAVLALSDSALDDEMLNWLSEAYIDTGEYKKAIAVLESQRERLDSDYKWHFRMGLALYRASEDEECEDDDSLRRNILERAKVALARGMNMNPPESALETADGFMERIEDELDELSGRSADDDDEDDDEDDELELYEEEELDAIEEHIKEYFGDFPTVFHEISSPDIHCDVCIVPPSEKRDYYTLVTMGMGAHVMDIPPDLSPEEHGRAELLICLPPDWKVGENSEEWFWPISLLKNLARLPLACETWLGWGHSVDNQHPFSDSAKFEGSLLLTPENVDDGAEACVLPNGDTVNFFEIIPLYREEMEFKIDHDTQSLLEEMYGVGHVVDITRPNMFVGYRSQKRPAPIDSAADHSAKIYEKSLPLDPKNGCNHIAIFFRWCIEHDLISPQLRRSFPELTELAEKRRLNGIREFMLDVFGGELQHAHLNYLGANFAHDYYDWDRDCAPYFYPADVDDCAEKFFGKEKYNSAEFQDEAYLFMPFDEKYCQAMSRYIDRAFRDFYADFSDYMRLEFTQVLRAVSKALGISGSVCSDEIAKEYKLAVREAKFADRTPIVLIMHDDGSVSAPEKLAEALEDSLDPFLEPIAIVDIPSRDVTAWAAEKFDLAPPEAFPCGVPDFRETAQKLFGTVPALLTFDENSSALFLPTDDSRYLRFTGKGIPFADE